MFFAKNIGSFDARQHQYFSTSRLCIRCVFATGEPRLAGNRFAVTVSK